MEFIMLGGLRLPVFEEHELRRLQPSSLREHALQIQKALSLSIGFVELPDLHENLLEWVLKVHRLHLEPLRSRPQTGSMATKKQFILGEAHSRHAQLLAGRDPGLAAGLLCAINDGLLKCHNGVYGDDPYAGQRKLAEDIYKELSQNKDGFSPYKEKFLYFSVATGNIAYAGNIPCFCYKVAYPDTYLQYFENAWITIFFVLTEEELRVLLGTPNCGFKDAMTIEHVHQTEKLEKVKQPEQSALDRIPLYTDLELAALDRAALRNHASLLYRALGNDRVGTAPPMENHQDLSDWVRQVQCLRLDPRRAPSPRQPELVALANMQIALYTDSELATLERAALCNHASLLYRALGIDRIGISPPMADRQDLVQWVKQVQRKHLEPLRMPLTTAAEKGVEKAIREYCYLGSTRVPLLEERFLHALDYASLRDHAHRLHKAISDSSISLTHGLPDKDEHLLPWILHVQQVTLLPLRGCSSLSYSRSIDNPLGTSSTAFPDRYGDKSTTRSLRGLFGNTDKPSSLEDRHEARMRSDTDVLSSTTGYLQAKLASDIFGDKRVTKTTKDVNGDATKIDDETIVVGDGKATTFVNNLWDDQLKTSKEFAYRDWCGNTITEKRSIDWLGDRGRSMSTSDLWGNDTKTSIFKDAYGDKLTTNTFSDATVDRSAVKTFSDVRGDRHTQTTATDVLGDWMNSRSSSIRDLWGGEPTSSISKDAYGDKVPTTPFSNSLGDKSATKKTSDIYDDKFTLKRASDLLGERTILASYQDRFGNISKTSNFSDPYGDRPTTRYSLDTCGSEMGKSPLLDAWGDQIKTNYVATRSGRSLADTYAESRIRSASLQNLRN